ncbi:hypothetical protein B0H19DRAFT_1080678 [Mycena capillaripes]|nr:hypothetical protein B0H19DRAFT_1080678 [Mycena capillaripes]
MIPGAAAHAARGGSPCAEISQQCLRRCDSTGVSSQPALPPHYKHPIPALPCAHSGQKPSTIQDDGWEDAPTHFAPHGAHTWSVICPLLDANPWRQLDGPAGNTAKPTRAYGSLAARSFLGACNVHDDLTGFSSTVQLSGDSSWVYKALDSVNSSEHDHHWDQRTIIGVAGLFNALYYYNTPPEKEHIHLLLQALLIPGNISACAAGLLLRSNIAHWFQDDDWRPFIQEDLCSWITIFFRSEQWGLAEKYSSVLSGVWKPNPGEYEFTDHGEKALGLSKLWENNLNFSDSSAAAKDIKILRCTSCAILWRDYETFSETGLKSVKITVQFITCFSIPLHTSITHAAAKIKNLAGTNKLSAETEAIAKILEDIARKMPSSVSDHERQGQGRYYWSHLRGQFQTEIDELVKSLQ